MEDIAEEGNYWNPSLVCYVLGTNPPLAVLEGFCRRIWRNMGVDKMSGLGQGVYIVRFNSVEQRDFVLSNGIMLFDMKLLIMKPWNAHEELKKEDMQRVPIWIQLTNLELKVRSLFSEAFHDFLIECDLLDIPYSDYFFTWNNKQSPPDRIVAKLDRVLSNPAWLEVFSNVNVRFLLEGLFDHMPAVLSFSKTMELGKKPFLYFKMWQRFSGYQQCVSEAWQSPVHGTLMYRVVTKLKRLNATLKKLNIFLVGDIGAAYSHSEQLLQKIQQQVHDDPQNTQLRDAYLEFLSQKVKLSWIQLGDANTQAFHRRIRQRRLQNSVMAIRDEQGQWHDTQMGIQSAFLDYYQHLLGGKYQGRRRVQRCVMNEGEEESEAVLSFLATGNLLKEINTTTITLIPKDNCAESVSDFRAISCCNVLYKVAAKLLCSRLRQVLPDLVASNQGGFIQGRYIGHNVMVCQDLIRHCGRKGGKLNCILKMDIRKAYDIVEWDFLEEMVVDFRFPHHFIHLIMVHVRTPKFSIMLNGSLHGFFNANWGLRQGDPMSHLLFVLGMEYLSRILKKIARGKNFQFHERCAELQLTHLCFTDDVVLFSHGDFKSVY
ncbi:uncharacterized protein LOC133785484 [Humulus lupulus]|uniref:uncharacterized protein LOC133785484 n=1 Tax=Humulus lupulus TaxID=3486 RepID=UPI002B41566F|nr:uncharacterized protein LOC133785484 [Humulus lupulus]